MDSNVKSGWDVRQLAFGILFVSWLFIGFTFAKEVYVFAVGEHANIVSAESSNFHTKRVRSNSGGTRKVDVCDITYSWYDTNGDLQYTVDKSIELDSARHILADNGENYPVIYYMKDNPDNYTLVFGSNNFVFKGFCYLLGSGFFYMLYKANKKLSGRERELDSAIELE